jgi:hypothetical protein
MARQAHGTRATSLKRAAGNRPDRLSRGSDAELPDREPPRLIARHHLIGQVMARQNTPRPARLQPGIGSHHGSGSYPRALAALSMAGLYAVVAVAGTLEPCSAPRTRPTSPRCWHPGLPGRMSRILAARTAAQLCGQHWAVSSRPSTGRLLQSSPTSPASPSPSRAWHGCPALYWLRQPVPHRR